MNLLRAWQLVLNATTPIILNSTARWSARDAAGGPTCNSRDPEFDSDACHVRATGFTKSQLQTKVYNSTDAPTPGPPCNRTFYVFGLDEFEELYPGVRKCRVFTYGAAVHAAALEAPCRAKRKAGADLLMLPPYLADECNWPAYSESCQGKTNVFRDGQVCGVKEVREDLARVQSDNPDTPILLVDMSNTPDRASNPTPIFVGTETTYAEVGALSSFPHNSYRWGLDVSMPPAATPRCRDTPSQAFSEPLDAKKYFLSFKGQMKQKMRSNFTKYHNGRDVVIVHSNDTKYDFDELLYGSRFNLVLEGDREYSYRFVEAVCSGGVPVLVSDHWMPPFNEFLPFEDYGVLVSPERADDLLGLLHNLTAEEVQRKRSAAGAACKEYFVDTRTQVRALIRLVLAHPLSERRKPAYTIERWHGYTIKRWHG